LASGRSKQEDGEELWHIKEKKSKKKTKKYMKSRKNNSGPTTAKTPSKMKI